MPEPVGPPSVRTPVWPSDGYAGLRCMLKVWSSEIHTSGVERSMKLAAEAPAAWVMVTVCLSVAETATVSVPVRSSPSLGAAVTVMLPFPLPEPGSTDSQRSERLTVHAALDSMETVALPPLLAKESVAGETESVSVGLAT